MRQVIAQVFTQRTMAAVQTVTIPYQSPSTGDAGSMLTVEHTTIFDMLIRREIQTFLHTIEAEADVTKGCLAQ